MLLAEAAAAAAAAPLLGFVIRWKHLKPSASPSLHERRLVAMAKQALSRSFPLSRSGADSRNPQTQIVRVLSRGTSTGAFQADLNT
jgi:hypothetical protein